MFKTNVPIYFKKAIIKDIHLTKDEIILQTIYNSKCLSLKNLWSVLPKEEFGDELISRNALKQKYLLKMHNLGALIRDKPEDNFFKKGGYSVDVKSAYKDKLPYTLMGLNPLPPLDRIDYIFHLILYKDPKLPYEIFPEEKHEFLDKLAEEAVFLAEKLMKEDATGLFSSELVNFLRKHDHNVKQGDPNYIYASERRNFIAESYQQKMMKLPAYRKMKEEENREQSNDTILDKI